MSEDRGILHNELYDTAWSGILAIILMPVVAPAKEIAKCVFNKNGENYYAAKGIALQNAVIPVWPCLQDTFKEVEFTAANKEKFFEVFRTKLEAAYAEHDCHLDYSNYSGEYGTNDLWEFLGNYYDYILDTLNKK